MPSCFDRPARCLCESDQRKIGPLGRFPHRPINVKLAYLIILSFTFDAPIYTPKLLKVNIKLEI